MLPAKPNKTSKQTKAKSVKSLKEEIVARVVHTRGTVHVQHNEAQIAKGKPLGDSGASGHAISSSKLKLPLHSQENS